MRMFTGIPIPDEPKEELIKAQEQLKGIPLKASWTKPENLHITLKFLGEVDDAMVPQITKALEGSPCPQGSFIATLEECGIFPNLRTPRIAWISLSRGEKEVKHIFKHIQKSLLSFGFGKEKRPFKSHITLGRIKYVKDTSALIQRFEELNLEKISWQINGFILYKSILTSGGPIYEAIKEYPLQAT